MKQTKDIVLGILQKVAGGFLAGMLISLGGAVFLACTPAGAPLYSKFVGALLFSMALLCICMRGYALYTGKIGLVLDNHKKEDVSLLLLCLLGNLLGTVAFGYLIGWVLPSLKETAYTLCSGKLEQGYGFGLLRGVLCGILVYLAIDLYRNNKSTLGIVMCIPAFILSGYEHSIADMFYFACSGIVSFDAFLYLWMIILGNSLGALLIPALLRLRPSHPSAPASDSDSGSKSASKSNFDSDPNSNPEPESEPESDSNANSNSKSGSDSNSNPESDFDSESESDSNANSNSKSGFDSAPDSTNPTPSASF